ncbi:hypothetical protein HR12_34450 [Microbacterium sp. SUBG005]|nr:hypothetical protein HR12_34450 [Microbacterium sp. SUBG005]
MGGARPHMTQVDAETVDAVLEDLDGALVHTGAVVTVDASTFVRADDTLLRVLLQNLIANAVKFTVAAENDPRRPRQRRDVARRVAHPRRRQRRGGAGRLA